MKAYLKEGRALRIETTINNATDFALHETLNRENWQALRHQGTDINGRFLAALGDGNVEPPDPAALEHVVLPTVHEGQRAPGLRFGDPRTTALLASVAAFAHVMAGLTNKSMRAQMQALWNPDYTSAQASYDLRRLRMKGFITRTPGTNTYRVTSHGLRVAAFLTHLANRVVVPTLTDLAALSKPRPPLATRPVTTAWRSYETALNRLLADTRQVA